MAGIVAYGAYVPYHRLQRSEIAAVLGEGGGKGTRAVASYDEDATSMGVEAARIALRSAAGAAAGAKKPVPERVIFATANPPYLDKTNAAVIHAALDLPPSTLAVDAGGAVRSGVGALLSAADARVPALVVLSDVRTGLPGGADERDGGDAAAAFLFGGDPPSAQGGVQAAGGSAPGNTAVGAAGGGAPVLAELIAVASTTDEFLDRWRSPGAPASRVWEERFGEHVYGPLADAAFADALKQAGLSPGDVDHLAVAGLATRAVKKFAGSAGVRAEALASDLTAAIGNAGTAQAGVLLADLLDRAEPEETIALVVLADGATVLLFRTTAALAEHRSAPGFPSMAVGAQIAAGHDGLRYATFLNWRGILPKEPPRRPDPDAPAAPPSHRTGRYKYGFVGSRCDDCGAVHLPPVRVCVQCGAVDRMSAVPMADATGTVATFTVDRLAYTPSPPMVAAVIDFAGGGRFRCQLTDVDHTAVAIGDQVEMTFRRMLTANGVHNYFWKARPVRRQPTAGQPVAGQPVAGQEA
ncbi:MAG: hydroxymethylglutaryl-CoA synthase [Actinomycetota bacterium]|nr:hydroxymethylglutaryl-CoA synthase [Actinomycetota bacterium]